MKLIDTHCHLDLIDEPVEHVIDLARSSYVEWLVVPSVSGWPENYQELSAIERVRLAWGVHPDYIDQVEHFPKTKSDFDIIPIAIGECGLDKRSKFDIDQQLRVFKLQLDLALKLNVPVIVHLVGHYLKAFELIREAGVKAVIHNASCSLEMAERFISIGCMISLSGNQLFSQSGGDLIKNIPLESLLIETDAPDGKNLTASKSQPANIKEIATEIAFRRGIDVADFCQAVYENSLNFFALDK